MVKQVYNEIKTKKDFDIPIQKSKCSIMGLDGSGKSHIAKQLIKYKDLVFLVWTYDKKDFTKEPDRNFIIYDFKTNSEFGEFCYMARKLAEKGLINGILIEDFDFLFQGNVKVPEDFNRLITMNRHHDLAVITTSKRPQDIKTNFVETSHYIISYSLRGDNVRKKFNNIYKGLGDVITEELKYTMESPDNTFICLPPDTPPILYK